MDEITRGKALILHLQKQDRIAQFAVNKGRHGNGSKIGGAYSPGARYQTNTLRCANELIKGKRPFAAPAFVNDLAGFGWDAQKIRQKDEASELAVEVLRVRS